VKAVRSPLNSDITISDPIAAFLISLAKSSRGLEKLRGWSLFGVPSGWLVAGEARVYGGGGLWQGVNELINS
jgi:hypothetical protein